MWTELSREVGYWSSLQSVKSALSDAALYMYMSHSDASTRAKRNDGKLYGFEADSIHPWRVMDGARHSWWQDEVLPELRTSQIQRRSPAGIVSPMMPRLCYCQDCPDRPGMYRVGFKISASLPSFRFALLHTASWCQAHWSMHDVIVSVGYVVGVCAVLPIPLTLPHFYLSPYYGFPDKVWKPYCVYSGMFLLSSSVELFASSAKRLNEPTNERRHSIRTTPIHGIG